CTSTETFAVVGENLSTNGITQSQRLLQHHVEHRREVTGRGVDDAQHLGGRGLLLQRLTRLRDKPRVLHRDDGLVPEGLKKCDLLVRKYSLHLSVNIYYTEQRPVLA